MLYVYVVVSLAVGLSSRSIGLGWRVGLSLLTIALGIVLNTWRWIDVARDDLLGTLERLAEGTFFYLIPSVLVFAPAYLVGLLLSYAFIKKR